MVDTLNSRIRGLSLCEQGTYDYINRGFDTVRARTEQISYSYFEKSLIFQNKNLRLVMRSITNLVGIPRGKK